MYRYDGKKVRGTVCINGMNYHTGFFDQLNAAELAALGVQQVADPELPNPDLYSYVEELDGTLTVTAYSEQDLAAKLATTRAIALDGVDRKADAVYALAIGNRGIEYQDAYKAALAYQAAGYTGAVPEDIQVSAAPVGKTAQQEADTIIAMAAALNTIKLAIRGNRIAVKEAIRAAAPNAETGATAFDAVRAAEAAWDTFDAYIRGVIAGA